MNTELQSRWDDVRAQLRTAELDGSEVWWDDDEIQDAIREATLKGIDLKLILACREAGDSKRDILHRVRTVKAGKPRILAVDDEVGFLETLALNLEDLHFDVRTESDATLALDVAREFLPELILLDIVMPDVDGLQLLGEIQKDESLKGVRVIMLTALASSVKAGGVTDHGTLFLAKPISMNRLVHCINEHLTVGR